MARFLGNIECENLRIHVFVLLKLNSYCENEIENYINCIDFLKFSWM